MTKRKLQVFISSTYEDLTDQRLAAMEAVLAAGHIPAAMEQFSPGDETAWEKIRAWIDESDAFILILGGRYGSIEPVSHKSYVQMEYEYALAKKKPFFSLVISDQHHEQRVKMDGLRLDERQHQAEYDQFKRLVTQHLCRIWNDRKDIQAAIFQKLPEWTQRQDLIGWIRADAAPTAGAMNEFARLSEENRDLRSQIASKEELFEGLTFERVIGLLRSSETPDIFDGFSDGFFFVINTPIQITQRLEQCAIDKPRNAGELFEALHDVFATEGLYVLRRSDIRHAFDQIAAYGLVSREDKGNVVQYSLNDMGRRFRNRMLLVGDADQRRQQLWSTAKG